MDDIRKDGIHILGRRHNDAKDWNNYVQTSPSASFYHRFEWKAINESEFQHSTYYVAHTSDGAIDGILPLVLIKSRLFGRLLCSLPFVNYCGPSASTPEVESALLECAYEIATTENADYLELRALHVCDPNLPQSENKVSMTIPLANDPDQLWNAFTSKHRNNIRRAYKSGLRVECGRKELLDAFFDIMSDSWRSLGTPFYRKSYFKSILEEFGDQAQIFVAYQGNVPIATAFNGFCKGTVEGLWAGSLLKHRKMQSNYVLYWEMIKNACEEGFDNFHLGRTAVQSGSVSFKKKWGANPKQLYWQYYLPNGGDIPQLNVNNPKYALAIGAWKKLPIWLTRTIGPLISRNIP